MCVCVCVLVCVCMYSVCVQNIKHMCLCLSLIEIYHLLD